MSKTITLNLLYDLLKSAENKIKGDLNRLQLSKENPDLWDEQEIRQRLSTANQHKRDIRTAIKFVRSIEKKHIKG